jgi:nitrite reductase (NADH) small subunit
VSGPVPLATAAAPAWVAVCRVEDVPRTGARRVARPGLIDVAVFRTGDDRLFALLDRCPHRGGPLSQGIVFGESVACPLHGWTIGLATGTAREPDVGCTPAFALRVEDGVVHLDARELAALGAGAERPVAGPARRPACAA